MAKAPKTIVPGAALTLLEWKLLQWFARRDAAGAVSRSFTATERGTVYIHGAPGYEFTAPACEAALRLRARGWFDADSHGNHRLNAKGQAAAAATPEPGWAPPAPPKLQPRDWEVLEELSTGPTNAWLTPLECGGRSRSHHSASLTKLVQHGYALCRGRGLAVLDASTIIPPPHLFHMAKGSRRFQITDAGRTALAQWHAQLQGNGHG